MIAEKKKMKRTVANPALEKTVLLRERDMAVINNDTEALSEIDERLSAIQEMADAKHREKSSSLDAWKELNKRNRQTNLYENRQAELKQAKKQKSTISING